MLRSLFRDKEAYSVFQFPEFRSYITARVLGIVAINIQIVAVGWQIYEITKDPLSLGLIGLAEAIPALSMALYAGHVADTMDRRKIVLRSYLLFLFCALALAFVSFDSIKPSTLPIYGVVFIIGLARSFMAPANFSLLTQIIPKKYYPTSAAWNSSIFQIGAMGGAAIGGLVYGFFGPTVTYVLVAFLMIAAVSFVFKIAPKGVPAKEKKETLKESLMAGIKFVFKDQVLFGALSLDLVAVLFGGAVALLPVFAEEILKVGPEGLGFLRAAPAVGALVTSLYLAYRPPLKRTGGKLLISVLGFGVSIILFALSNNFYLSLFFLALSGGFDNVSVVIRSTIVQLLTPDNMRGRVASVNMMFIGSSNELGAFESGVAAKFLGLIPSVILGGCVSILTVGVAGYAAPKLRKLNLKE